MPHNLLTYVACLLFFVSCHRTPATAPHSAREKDGSGIKYADNFSIKTVKGYRCIYLFGVKGKNDTAAQFVLANDTTGLSRLWPGYSPVKIPVTKIVAMGSLYANMLDALGALPALAGVDNMQYIGNPRILATHRAKAIPELGLSPEIDLEKTWHLQPQLILSNGPGNHTLHKLQDNGIPVCYITDHLEKSPLARAEWMKVVAAFLEKDSVAAVLFDSTEKHYLDFKKAAAARVNKPRVFTEARFGDVWYMPGGASYMACLLKDAGAAYVWADNADAGSLPLSFEQVVVKAAEADFWINPSGFKSLNEMQQAENRYTTFKAFKHGNVYNNTLHLNQFGYSNYWESGLLFPDKVLGDLIHIFHPEVKLSGHPEFTYYKRLP